METRVISDHLIKINKEGILTINSQPNVSCAPSTHKIFGWGDPGGFVFQKVALLLVFLSSLRSFYEDHSFSGILRLKDFQSFLNCSNKRIIRWLD